MSVNCKFDLLAIMLAVALAGCGQEASNEAGTGKSATAGAAAKAAGTTGDLDPCSLITQSEAEAILGGALEGPNRESGFGQFSQCQYLAAGERISDMGSITVQIHPIDFASQRKAFLDAGEEIKPVSGVGEAAFWVPGHSTLHVQKGGLTAAFAVHKDGVDMLGASKTLAVAGVARLP